MIDNKTLAQIAAGGFVFLCIPIYPINGLGGLVMFIALGILMFKWVFGVEDE